MTCVQKNICDEYLIHVSQFRNKTKNSQNIFNHQLKATFFRKSRYITKTPAISSLVKMSVYLGRFKIDESLYKADNFRRIEGTNDICKSFEDNIVTR